jgi:hypothetical protein
MFTREAVISIFEHSRGIPRTINVICDNALVTGYATDRRLIDADIIFDVCRDFDLHTGEGRSGRPDRPPSEPSQPAPLPPARQETSDSSSQPGMFATAKRRGRFSFF